MPCRPYMDNRYKNGNIDGVMKIISSSRCQMSFMHTCLANMICPQSHDGHTVHTHVGSTVSDAVLEFRTVAGKGARGLKRAPRSWSAERVHTPGGQDTRVEGFGMGQGRCSAVGSYCLALSSSSHCC